MSDWRLRNQEKFLTGVELNWQKYSPYREGWDHDHCEFCSAKFSTQNADLQEGYATKYAYHWICKKCFDDFKEKFNWRVI